MMINVMFLMRMQVVMGLLVLGCVVCSLMVLVAILLVVVRSIEMRIMSVIQTKFLMINIVIEVWHQSMRGFMSLIVITFWRVMAVVIMVWISISIHCFMIMVSTMLVYAVKLWVELCISHVVFWLSFNEMNI